MSESSTSHSDFTPCMFCNVHEFRYRLSQSRIKHAHSRTMDVMQSLGTCTILQKQQCLYAYSRVPGVPMQCMQIKTLSSSPFVAMMLRCRSGRIVYSVQLPPQCCCRVQCSVCNEPHMVHSEVEHIEHLTNTIRLYTFEVYMRPPINTGMRV